MNINKYVVFAMIVGMIFLSVRFYGSTEGFGGAQHHFRDVNAAILNFTTAQNEVVTR